MIKKFFLLNLKLFFYKIYIINFYNKLTTKKSYIKKIIHKAINNILLK